MLERAITAAERAGEPHPGLLHLYVHAMEMSPHPERALRAADVLRDLVPDAGHLRHMPTHIDVLCGEYRDVVVCNEPRDRRRPQVPRARGAAQLLLALPLPRLPLQDLRRDVPRPARARARGGRRADRDAAGGAAADRGAADGRLDRGLRADAAARARPLRPVGGDRRRAVPGRSRPLLRDDGDAALREGRRARRARRRRGSRGSAVALRRARSHACPTPATCSTTRASTSWPSRPRC